jgi:hypothetical protein
MANPRRAATILQPVAGSTGLAKIAAERGEPTPKWVVNEDTGDLYRWVPGNTDTADGFNIIEAASGTVGRFHRVVADRHGVDLGDADATITVAQGLIRIIPDIPLTDARTITISATGAKPGDEIELVRQDTSANTITVIDAVTTNTIATLDAGLAIVARFRFRTAGWYQSWPGTL